MKCKITQAQIQAEDDPPQEIYLVLGFELMGVPLAQQQAIQPNLALLFAVSPLEGMIELAGGLAPGVLGEDLAPEHRESLPVGRARYLPG
jgi:hypothetical protein